MTWWETIITLNFRFPSMNFHSKEPLLSSFSLSKNVPLHLSPGLLLVCYNLHVLNCYSWQMHFTGKITGSFTFKVNGTNLCTQNDIKWYTIQKCVYDGHSEESEYFASEIFSFSSLLVHFTTMDPSFWQPVIKFLTKYLRG